jgi:putative endonuclease
MLYVGVSTDLEQRFSDHMSGQACRTTALDPPMSVLRVEVHDSLATARAREAQLKRWSRAKKEALIRGDIETLKSLSQSRD